MSAERTGRSEPWFLNAYAQLFLTALLVAVAEVFLKKGAALSQTVGDPAVLGFSALAWRATWYGILFHILGFLSWLSVLRLLPLVEAFALINVVHVIVPIASTLFLKESLSLSQFAGIALVVAGTFFVATAAAGAEEKL